MIAKSIYLLFCSILIMSCHVKKQQETRQYSYTKGKCLSDSFLDNFYFKCPCYFVVVSDTFKSPTYVKTNSLEFFLKKNEEKSTPKEKEISINFESAFSNDSIQIKSSESKIVFNGVVPITQKSKGLSLNLTLPRVSFYEVTFNNKYVFRIETFGYDTFRILKTEKEMILIRTNRNVFYQ